MCHVCTAGCLILRPVAHQRHGFSTTNYLVDKISDYISDYDFTLKQSSADAKVQKYNWLAQSMKLHHG